MASVTPFGQDGPYAQYQGADILYYALGGMNMTGDPGLYPIKKAASMVEHQVGNALSVATAAAFFSARHQGRAQHLDLAAAEVAQTSVDRRVQLLLGHAYTGECSRREPLSSSALPMGIFPCQDGHVQIVTTPAWADRMAKALGRPDIRNRMGGTAPDHVNGETEHLSRLAPEGKRNGHRHRKHWTPTPHHTIRRY
jgi:crotonobetainyl-CoA:carnitine CoA-transferase CaiB-like acyl-CoA transferase